MAEVGPPRYGITTCQRRSCFPAHCDIVVDTTPAGVLGVIGGNISDAVTMRHIPVTADGKLAGPDGVVLESTPDVDGGAEGSRVTDPAGWLQAWDSHGVHRTGTAGIRRARSGWRARRRRSAHRSRLKHISWTGSIR